MSLIVTSLLVASGVLLGRYLARSRKPPAEEEDDDEEDQREKTKEPKKEEPKVDLLEGFACKLGDVVMRSAGEEAWLAGALVLTEQFPVATLFVAPEAGGDLAVLAKPSPVEDLLWLSPVPADAIGLTGKEPPATLEHGSDRFERTKRIPVRAVRLGSGAPDVGETVIFAEYTSLPGDRMVVLMGPRIAAFRGVLLEAGTFTVLPSGKASLEE
jgi:hypothetical protein